jgi:hypothetical protein
LALAALDAVFDYAVVQNGARARAAAPAGNDQMNQATMVLYNALKKVAEGMNTLNKTKVIPAALQDVIDGMTAYETANNVTLSGPKAIASILKDTIGCTSITGGITGSVGIGTREDTPSPVSVGAAATIAKAHLLLQLRPPDIRRVLDAIVAARTNADTAIRASRDAAQQLSEALVDRDFVQNLMDSLNGCIDANSYMGYAPPAFVVVCLVRSGYAADLARQAVSGNLLTRLQRVRDAAQSAQTAANAAATTAQIAVGAATSSARDLATQIASQLGAITRSTARCAVDTATVPFATTIYDAATQ